MARGRKRHVLGIWQSWLWQIDSNEAPLFSRVTKTRSGNLGWRCEDHHGKSFFLALRHRSREVSRWTTASASFRDPPPSSEPSVYSLSGEVGSSGLKGPDLDAWALEELSLIVDRLSSKSLASEGHQIRFCFFIDGLNDYDGDHRDIIELLRRMSACSDIKICASSRP